MFNRKLLAAMLAICLVACFPGETRAQHHHADDQTTSALVRGIEAQPLLAHAQRIQKALDYLGSSLPQPESKKLAALKQRKPDGRTVEQIQLLLDPFCLAVVDINPEARIKVRRGAANATLIQAGWKTFLVKVINSAGTTAPLEVESPQALPLLHMSQNTPHTMPGHELTEAETNDRFLEVAMYRNQPMLAQLSGLGLEYAIIQIYCKDKGSREAEIGFHIGQGKGDLGFRSAIPILFNALPAVKVIFKIKDENDEPATASFIIQDNVERLLPDSAEALSKIDYRLKIAANEYNVPSGSLKGIYPLPSRRLALTDEYPDFFFQPQVYRSDGEHLLLPPGHYRVSYTRGPEHVTQVKELVIGGKEDSVVASFKLKRWVNMDSLGWLSADHHIHAAGCSHYDSPQEGVDPAAMVRQIEGEDLNIAAVLTWGPGWYHQKKNFTGADYPLSARDRVMHYDVEVSGFPSSHAGHLVLLHLKEDDYPGTQTIEDWPSWTAPVLQWAKGQGAITGYAHSGWGLEPQSSTEQLPNSVVPRMDGIGANEYIVTVTQGLIDFFSAGDTPAPWELNMWYHSLNCGFRARLSGETDFPCIFDERVGIARSYCRINGPVTYPKYIDAIKNGHSYVTDGRSHITHFAVENISTDSGTSELRLDQSRMVTIKANVAALLDAQQSEDGRGIAKRPLTESPYWHIERARIGSQQKVAVELLFNGVPVDTVPVMADGKWKQVTFKYPIKQSGWFALRIFPSAHTNPLFAIVNNQPIHVAQSVDWCIEALDQCWKNKEQQIRPRERAAAKAMYDKARAVYFQLK